MPAVDEPEPRHMAPEVLEAPRQTSLWIWCIVGSIVLHVVVGAIVFLGFEHADTAPPAEQPIVAIELMPAPSAPPVTPHQAPPGPQQVENHAKPPPTKEQFKIPPAPEVRNVTPEVVAPPKSIETPNPAKSKPVADETTAPPAVIAPPSAKAAATVRGAPVTGVDNAEQTWEGAVLAEFERRKRYPGEAQRAGQQDVVYVRLTVDRTGRILSAHIEKSQHFQLLDNAVLDVVRRSNPLPAPPPSVPGTVVEFVVPFDFFIGKHGPG